jgi:hypothetical protein
MNWVKKTFFEKPPREHELPSEPVSHSTSFHEYDIQPQALDVRRADVRAARELIYSCAKQTALIYGIPPQWLAFEVLTISDDEQAFFQLQVQVMEWDEHLFARSYAFELALMKRLGELNMAVARAVRAVLWRVKHEAGCPYDELPGPEAWTPEAVARRAAARQAMPMPVPVNVQPLSESEKRALVRPDAAETVAPAFFATSAMDDLHGPVGSAKHVDTEAEYEAAKRRAQPPSTQPDFYPTTPTLPGSLNREA